MDVEGVGRAPVHSPGCGSLTSRAAFLPWPRGPQPCSPGDHCNHLSQAWPQQPQLLRCSTSDLAQIAGGSSHSIWQPHPKGLHGYSPGVLPHLLVVPPGPCSNSSNGCHRHLQLSPTVSNCLQLPPRGPPAAPQRPPNGPSVAPQLLPDPLPARPAWLWIVAGGRSRAQVTGQ